MLRNLKTLDDVKDAAIRVDGSMIIRFPDRLPSSQLEMHRPHLSDDKKHTFCERNDVIAFVDDPNDAEYIIPSTTTVKSILTVEGFVQRAAIVALANHDVPYDRDLCNKWQRLMADRIDILRSEFMEDSMAYCYTSHVGDIPLNLANLWMNIPEEGFGVTNVHYSEIIHPPVKFEDGLTPENASKLGTYATRNGVTIFVSNYGRSYLTASKYIIEELKKVGYREYPNGMFVPLSNGEVIMSPDISTRWMSVQQQCATYDKKYKAT